MHSGVLHVFILSVCLGQILTVSAGIINPWHYYIRERIYGVSEQFVDDYKFLCDKSSNDSNALSWLDHPLLLTLFENGKIDADKMKDLYMTDPNFKRPNEDIAMEIDDLKILKSILSKQFPSERYNGMVNLLYVLTYPKATSEEIQTALNYLYGVDTAATQTSFLDAHHFPDLSASACPELFQNYSDAVDKLKSMNGIKAKVQHDFNAIHDKFPCNQFLYRFLLDFVDKNMKFHNDACMIANARSTKHMRPTAQSLTTYFAISLVQSLETTLSTRLSDETYRGLLNYAKAFIPDTPVEEIQTSLVSCKLKQTNALF